MTSRLSRERLKPAAKNVSYLMLTAAGLGAVLHYSLTDPAEAFERRYAAEGKCLEDSPYDRDAGARYIRDRTLFADAELTVVPAEASETLPSVLQFDAETSLGRVVLHADAATSEFLAMQCVPKADADGGVAGQNG